MTRRAPFLVVISIAALAFMGAASQRAIDVELMARLRALGFTGSIATTLEPRLGRKVDARLADLGRLLWFDTVGGLNNDNTCGGCHSPTHGFGDTQSIAIGIENNGIVGLQRTGPRNQRRTPMAINTAFYPRLMWNSRFEALSGDPFKNDRGFAFPNPEGTTLSHVNHLLQAQAFIPPTERVEVAGFVFPGSHDAIRREVVRRLNEIEEYRTLFGNSFPSVKQGAPIDFEMFARATAEFEFTLVFANAPIDRYARGDRNALSDDQKQGAALFFGRAHCVECHAVTGQANEMFSDFREHVIGVPQVVPEVSNVPFDGAGANEDFGLEQVTGNPIDRYAFRTSPLRNVALQPSFFHNGAFTRLEDAIRHHLNVVASARAYDPRRAGVAADLRGPTGPIEPVLARLDPLVATPVTLTDTEFRQLLDFVRNGLTDPAARPERLRQLIPLTVPSRRPVPLFEEAEEVTARPCGNGNRRCAP
jgi:cytochrome c peroxidase